MNKARDIGYNPESITEIIVRDLQNDQTYEHRIWTKTPHHIQNAVIEFSQMAQAKNMSAEESVKMTAKLVYALTQKIDDIVQLHTLFDNSSGDSYDANQQPAVEQQTDPS